MSTFPSTTAPIIIENINIRQDTQGRFCLNDLHKAAGGLEKDKPKRWLRSQQAQELARKIGEDQKWPSVNTQPLKVIRGGPNQGTYVCEDLVYHYAMWIDADFSLLVIRTFKAVAKGQIKTSTPALPNFSNPAEAARAWADEYDKRLVAEQKVEYLQPKAAFVDNYVEANGTLGLREAAKALNIKPNYFTQKLRDDHILYYNVKKQNVAAQDYLDRGYFTVKTALHGANKKHLCYV